MKKILLFVSVFITTYGFLFAQTEYTTSVIFPAGYQIGDYVEFVRVAPEGAGASGYYEISISYTRNSVAAAATHLASISHANPALWREAGRINNNGYTSSDRFNFTIDCNTEYANPRFRIRAVNTWGAISDPLTVIIKVRSINFNTAWTALSNTGNDLTVNKFLPMTNDWSLYVGNPYTTDGANLALKAIENGNVGIGILNPTEKLSVNGRIRAKEIKVEAAPWPDYVFSSSHKLINLPDLEKYIHQNQHLPNIPSAKEVEKDGINLGEMNSKLLQKVEELTLYLIELNKKVENQEKEIQKLRNN
jgi:hypothetical protein